MKNAKNKGHETSIFKRVKDTMIACGAAATKRKRNLNVPSLKGSLLKLMKFSKPTNHESILDIIIELHFDHHFLIGPVGLDYFNSIFIFLSLSQLCIPLLGPWIMGHLLLFFVF